MKSKEILKEFKKVNLREILKDYNLLRSFRIDGEEYNWDNPHKLKDAAGWLLKHLKNDNIDFGYFNKKTMDEFFESLLTFGTSMWLHNATRVDSVYWFEKIEQND